MIDKQALLKDLDAMVERRKSQGAHLEFYMNPQKIMVSDIVFLINSGKYDIKENTDEVKDVKALEALEPIESPVKAFGCWSPDW